MSRRNITDKTLQSWIIKAKKENDSRNYIYNTSIVPNLYLRITPVSGVAYFVYKIKTTTKKTWFTIGEYGYNFVTLEQACKKANELKALVKQGIDPITHYQQLEDSKMTVGKVYDLMLQTLINKGSADNSQAQINSFRIKYLSLVADVKMEDLTVILIRERVLDPLIKEEKFSTANTCLRRFKQLSNFAHEREYISVNRLKMLKNDFYTPEVRDRVLSDDDIRKLFVWLNAHDDTPAKHIRLTLMLGTRLEELLKLKWEYVDLTKGTIFLPKEITKNKQALTIKLPSQALAVINELYSIKYGDYVFANGAKHYSSMTSNTRIKKILADTKMVKWGVHTLRHTFMTRNLELRFGSIDLIDIAVNHKLQGVRKNYIHTNLLEERHEMTQKWSDYMYGLVV